MKRLYNFLSLVFVCSGLLFCSCETTDLNLTQNPNALTPEQTNADLFLNAIEVNFGKFVENFGKRGAQLTRIDYMLGRNYQNVYSPLSFDEDWELAYSGILNNISAMKPLATADHLTKHLGVAQVIEAYTMVTLVDFFGDVPFTEANDPTNLNPKADSGASIYNAALVLLDKAIANFRITDSEDPTNDFYYGGDYDKWSRLANTIKMKIYVQRRLVDPDAVANFKTILNSGNYLQTTDDNCFFHWGNNSVNPDTRHPKYVSDYKSIGGGDYQSNWLMGFMNKNNDPRIRYYFYRQVDIVPGQDGSDPNQVSIPCSIESVPQHYTDGNFSFCGLPNGYWGLDHGNQAGIPPDGFDRTIIGVYPAAGNFDDSRFKSTGLGQGGGGAGVTPIMLASSVDFMKAELNLSGLSGSPGDAKQAMMDGMRKSIATVKSFGSIDPDADLTMVPSASDVTNYINAMGDAFDNASNMTVKWNVVAQQYWVSLFGNGIDAYDFYRRTGYPTTLQPNLEPTPGSFIRSNLYPAAYANRNVNATQKSGVSSQVFWDTNPPSPGFPSSN